MKVDATKLKKGSSELTSECRQLIDEITKCRDNVELMQFLENIKVWVYGKCELYHWIEILDRFDEILEEATRHIDGNEFSLSCDFTFSSEELNLLLLVLNFTTLLIEHSFSRHLYNSVEHLTELLSSQNMDIVLAVLNLLYMFSKRSNFIPRLSFEKKEMLLIKLSNIAERWGDPNYGLALIDCCLRKPKLEFLYQLFIEYMDDTGQVALLEIPDMMNISATSSPAEIVKTICKQMSNPSDAIKMRIAHRVRLVAGFKDYKLRLKFVQARLQAVSVLIYSNALQDNIDKVLYPGFGEELCELIDKEEVHLVDIRAAVLRTLTSLLHFDRNPNVPRPGSRLPKIIQYTGAERQGGILPLLVRDCISSLTRDNQSRKYPLMLATSLFSLLYHLASYEAGGHALVKSGMMQSLLCVINWPGVDLEHITFVTRAVRVIDLITNIDIAKFHQNNGLNVFIDRLEKEINNCCTDISEQQTETQSRNDRLTNVVQTMHDGIVGEQESRSTCGMDIIVENSTISDSDESYNLRNNDEMSIEQSPRSLPVAEAESTITQYPSNSYYGRPLQQRNIEYATTHTTMQPKKLSCVTQRAALLKSMLNFLKKSIQDHAHFNGMRNIMESSLPSSLRHIISNAEYYGPSLFLLATDVVTVYVFNEPSLLSSLQDLGITNVILQSLLQKDVPATREVLGSLPNVFSALCLNERGLMEFMSYEPFDKLLKVLLSPDYLVAMRKRRSSDPLGDTATNLGNAMDDLMKHHPYLRTDATEAIIRLLNELVRIGTDPSFICWRANKDNNQSGSSNNGVNNTNIVESANSPLQNLGSVNVNESGSNENENDSSGEEDDEDDEMSTASQQQQQRQNRLSSNNPQPQQQIRANPQERESIPLIDYILNVMKFIEAIFSNTSNSEHCREFVLRGGLKPLLELLSLPNLPIDSPVSTTAQAVANVCKSVLNLSHEIKVIDIALQQLTVIVEKLKPLTRQQQQQHQVKYTGGSILLSELLNCPKIEDGFSIAEYTPILHNMSSVHGFVVMLVHICRNASTEMRSILLKRWGTDSNTGLSLLQNLVQLYISLVWESTILLSLCSEESYMQNLDFSGDGISYNCNTDDNVKSSAERGDLYINLGSKTSPRSKLKPEEQLRYIKSLLAASSRLGRALAELFGTLVKLSVGTPQSRQRRNNDYLNVTNSKFPNIDARDIAKVLSSILVNGFNHESIISKPAAKLKLTFFICSVGFTGPMLFDDKRSSFHLMISQFCKENGLKAFFDMFFWALSLGNHPPKFSFERCMNIENILEDSDDDCACFPEGTGEFIDAWLQLLEKMVNPRAILDSPYTITSKTHNMPSSMQFEPIFYLIQIHQLTLQTIRRIWKKKPIANYGVSMTETIMTILKHLIKSHAMLRERYQLRVNEIKSANKSTEHIQKSLRPTPDELNINSNHLEILIDMGFMRHHVMEALRNSPSLEQATDYLLNHPEANSAISQSSELPILNEESARNFRIENTDMEVDDVSSNNINLPSTSAKQKQLELKLICDKVFDEFCEEALQRVFTFMEYLPETVSTGVEVMSVLYRRHNQSNKEEFVMHLVKDINDCAEHMLRSIKHNSNSKLTKLEEISSGPTAEKMFIRLKASTLLLDEMYADIRKEFCAVIFQDQCVNLLIKLLHKTESLFEEELKEKSKLICPRWLQTLIEFIDAIDNISLILQRKANMSSVCSENWKWYDASTGKWNSYSEANNLLIKNAFNNGERSVAINIGRQRYTVNFSCMTQVSETSGSHRPVLPSLKIVDAVSALTSNNTNPKVDTIVTRIIKSKSDGVGVVHQDETLCLKTLMNGNGNSTNDRDDTNANEFKNDKQDFTADGEESILRKMKTKKPANIAKKSPGVDSKRVQKIVLHEELIGLSKFNTASLITCLVRLIQPTIQLNMETKLSILKLCARLTKDYENAKIFVESGGVNILLRMRQNCGLMGFPTYAIVIIRHTLEAPSVLQESIERVLSARTSQTVPVGHRDLVFVLTQVSSAVARHPKSFVTAARQILTADYVTNTTFALDDSRLLVKSQLASNNFSTTNTTRTDDEVASIKISIDVIKELLRSIVQPCVHYGGSNYEDEQDSQGTEDAQHTKVPVSRKLTEKFEPSCCSWHIPSSAHTHQKPVLPRATLIKVLSDAVRSYQSLVPQVIMDHMYTPDDSPLIKNEQSCLSFLLDNFVPIVRRQQDSEVSMMSRVLIASLADCYGLPSVQMKLIEEIHNAIVRSLIQSNPAGKHTRLQVLIGLLPVMIESPISGNKIQLQRNNMYRILLRQGIMTDLCKISQYKDLSNSNTLGTMHSILRPMEMLLRLTVSTGSLSSKRIFFGTTPQGHSSAISRRYFPRPSTRALSNNINSIGGENVLRDIIRNVLSDRRHTFDFLFNADDLLMDAENVPPNGGGNVDEETDNNRDENRIAVNARSQLSFDRLWDDLLQNDTLRLGHRSSNGSGNAVANNANDHHRHHNHDGEAGNDNVGPGSDGASTSSEIAATVAESATNLLGEISTSESDSDSNLSTENDDRNDEDEDDDEEDEDDDDDDGNEGHEDRSETDADEESHQYIEVYDNIYEPESSETASNDADVEADDEPSVLNRTVPNTVLSNENADQEIGSVETHNHDEDQEPTTSRASRRSTDNRDIAPTANVAQGNASNVDGNHSSNVIRTNSTSTWVSPRLNFIRPEGSINYRTNMELNISNPNEGTPIVNNEGTDNSGPNNTSGNQIIHINTPLNNSQGGNGVQRRESTRRLVFLDQQYCAPMPSFGNPTEEGQIDLFNQDALHWWLEEAKYLDIESQTDACLYAAHLLIPFLLKDFKGLHNQTSDNATNRRSAIPVLIQQTNNTSTGVPNEEPATPENYEISHLNIQPNASDESETLRLTQSLQNTRTSDSPNSEQEHIEENVRMVEFDAPNEEESLVISDANNDDIEDEEDVYDDEDVEDEGELNTTFMNDDDLETNFNVDPAREDINLISQGCARTMDMSEDAAMEIPVITNESEIVNIPNNENIALAENDHEDVTRTLDNPNNTADSSVPVSASNATNVREAEAAALPSTVNTEIELISSASASGNSRAESNVPEMSPEVRAVLGDLEVPDGVDPSFLAALPSEMREEVIQEHLRMQRIRQRAQQNALQVAHDSLLEVNPEFLAALPPNIQTEVLMQQRIEQQRQAAQSMNPDDPVDTAAFFQNLPENLRQAILTDMEESQIASLPPELAAEAQFLRRDWENRNGGRLDAIQSNTLSGFLTSRFPTSLQNVSNSSRWHTNSIWYDANGTPQSQQHQHTTIVHHQQPQLHGKPIALLLMEDENSLLDPDSLATLLLFLFIEDPKINHARFHRVIRNLCYHLSSREWVISALISIIEKTNENKVNYSLRKSVKPQWLKLRVDAAFGYKSNVFIIHRCKESSGNNDPTSDYSININPQAAQMIVRNCLDMLFVLAKNFPNSFLPYHCLQKNNNKTMDVNINPVENLSSNVQETAGDSAENVSEFESNKSTDEDLSESATNLTTRRLSTTPKETEIKGGENKLDDVPSTSKAAAVKNQLKPSLTKNKVSCSKDLQYNTNAKNFWDVLLNIDIHTQKRLTNLQSFPMCSHPQWKWNAKSPDFLSFNDAFFSKLLSMLPYKVVCRSPMLTDMLIKLLASLSAELPKEDETANMTEESSFSIKRNDGNTPSNASADVMTLESEHLTHDHNYLSVEDDGTKSFGRSFEKENKANRKLYSKIFSHLQLAVEVLTHKCGTTDGLDNISKLIINLSNCSQAAHTILLQYLTVAILGLAQEVREAIKGLLNEIRSYNSTNKEDANASQNYFPKHTYTNIHQGIMQDRFTSENIVISASTNIKPSCELQLPAMKNLLSSSSQPYFLRSLKIFMQIRDGTSQTNSNVENNANNKQTLSQIICLDDLWETLSECLVALEEFKDEYAVLVLQPTVEAFFLIHASHKKNENADVSSRQRNQGDTSSDEIAVPTLTTNSHTAEDSKVNSANSTTTSKQNTSDTIKSNPHEAQMKIDRQKFLAFAEKHRTVLNQILRQSATHLSDGPFAVLVDHTRILDFDVKRKYFQTELERIDEGVRREENTVSVRRVTVFEDSFRVLYRLGPEEWKNRFYIVFEDEEGQDAGGLLREWYVIISREIFNPMYALFCVSPGDRVTYMINPSSHANPNHLSYFKFVGRVIAKAIHDNKLLECYFTRSFYKHILGKQVKHTDMESQDYEFYKGLDYLMKNDISTLGYELTFSTEVQEFGVTQVRDLIPNGRDIVVTEENKFDYVQLVCQLKMSGSIRQQLDAFLEGFYDIIPKHLISIFNEQELELLISGLPDIDIEDLKTNTEYHKYTSKSIQIQWFWRALRSFDQADRAKFLQFVTGTSKVPLQGFGSLEGMNGIQKFQIHRDDRSTDRLPCAHTCFNQLDLPMYKSYDKLRNCLLKAIHECSEGFGFA